MAPFVQALPRSESKRRFFARIGLDIRLALHRHLYALMKAEASEGRRRIIAIIVRQPRPLQHYQRAISTRTNALQFSTSQIDEVLLNAEAARIMSEAQSATRILYDLAFDPTNPNEPNWIIRWMLWHVFRYRDGRQKGHSPSLATITIKEDVSDDDCSSFGGSVPPGALQRGPGSSGLWRYDPVRNTWFPVS